MHDKTFQQKNLHGDTCRRLGRERKEAEEKCRELARDQHEAPSNWMGRNSELQMKIDELSWERTSLDEKLLETKTTIAAHSKGLQPTKAELQNIEDKRETGSEGSDTLKARVSSLKCHQLRLEKEFQSEKSKPSQQCLDEIPEAEVKKLIGLVVAEQTKIRISAMSELRIAMITEQRTWTTITKLGSKSIRI